MRAAVFENLDQPTEVRDVDLNGPEAGEVLVKVTACGVCHSDLHVMARMPGPAIFGHEAAGIVEAVGQGVDDLQPGDHVVCAFHPSCGRCYYCVRGLPQICDRTDFPDRGAGGSNPRLRLDGKPVRQGIGVGGFAEYTCMPRGGVVKVREDAPLDIVGLVGCGVTTGIGAAINTAKVKPGSTVAVIGCGGVGLNVIQGAKLAGAYRIIAVDTVPYKLELAQQFGATHAVNSANENAVTTVQQLADGHLDYAFEVVGLPVTVRQAWDMIRPGGMAVVVGLGREEVSIPLGGFLQEKKLIGSLYGSASIQADIPRIIDLYMDGRILLNELVSKQRPLAEVNEAFADMEAGTVARSVLLPS
ncbi:MAG: Zn-dependent alcohol dehydrogenase [Dehalococcoidia bacterium]